MAFEDTSSGIVMPVAPAYGNGGGFGMDGWWIILLFLCMGMGGGGMWGGSNNIYPWMNQADITTSGFSNQALQSGITGLQGAVTSGFGDVAMQMTGGFAGVNQALSNNEMASLNRSFAEQTANTQGFSNIASQLAQCCCDNRMATVQTQNVITTESAATRAAIQSGVQTVLDKMCQDKIDAKNEKIVELQSRINALESNNYLQNALTAQTQYIIDRYPVPTTTTAGTT